MNDWEYTYELRESDTGDVFDRSFEAWATYSDARTFGVLRAVEENLASPGEPPLEACVVRRRKAGSWVEVSS